MTKSYYLKRVAYINQAMSFYDQIFYNLAPRPSVIVVSDSMMADWKRKNTLNEIAELNKLIDGHKQSIERLETTVKSLEADLPALTEETGSE